MVRDYLRQLKNLWVVVGILAFLLFATLATGSLYLYDYTEHDPKFCVSCHIMEPAFAAWETSIHKGIECHDCHYATIIEKNQMLIKTFLEKPEKVSERPHGKILVPSSFCIQCHWKGKKVTKKISDSTGHALHWFKGDIECTSCHAVNLHQFSPEQKHCLTCHADRMVVQPKMKDMRCTECHNFIGDELVPKTKTCLSCHPHEEPSSPTGATPAHSQFGCATCHQTHGPYQAAKDTCVNCHSYAIKHGKHPIHLEALDNNCLSCHQPHQWKVTPEDAKTLCSECHKPYPLKKFS